MSESKEEAGDGKRTKEETWVSIREEYEILIKNLPTEIPYKPTLSQRKRIHLLAQYSKTGLKYRTANLTKTAIKLFEEDCLLPAIIITRSIFETVSLFFWLYWRLEKVVETGEIENIEEFLIRMGAGGRCDMALKYSSGEVIESLNVLSAIDKVDKVYEGIRKDYDFLSEFAHPNCPGGLMLFSQLNEKDDCIDFGFDAINKKLEEPQLYALKVLSFCIGIFIDCDEKMEELLPKFKEICDA